MAVENWGIPKKNIGNIQQNTTLVDAKYIVKIEKEIKSFSRQLKEYKIYADFVSQASPKIKNPLKIIEFAVNLLMLKYAIYQQKTGILLYIKNFADDKKKMNIEVMALESKLGEQDSLEKSLMLFVEDLSVHLIEKSRFLANKHLTEKTILGRKGAAITDFISECRVRRKGLDINIASLKKSKFKRSMFQKLNEVHNKLRDQFSDLIMEILYFRDVNNYLEDQANPPQRV
jgi:hypothetical protein